MRRNPAPALLLLLALGSAAACAERRPSFDDPSRPVQVRPGAEFELSLASNRSTGYQWVLVDPAGLGPLRPLGSRYEVPRHLRDQDGAGGREHWAFRADGPGEGVVSLVYVRPWESGVPADTVRFRVGVR